MKKFNWNKLGKLAMQGVEKEMENLNILNVEKKDDDVDTPDKVKDPKPVNIVVKTKKESKSVKNKDEDDNDNEDEPKAVNDDTDPKPINTDAFETSIPVSGKNTDIAATAANANEDDDMSNINEELAQLEADILANQDEQDEELELGDEQTGGAPSKDELNGDLYNPLYDVIYTITLFGVICICLYYMNKLYKLYTGSTNKTDSPRGLNIFILGCIVLSLLGKFGLNLYNISEYKKRESTTEPKAGYLQNNLYILIINSIVLFSFVVIGRILTERRNSGESKIASVFIHIYLLILLGTLTFCGLHFNMTIGDLLPISFNIGDTRVINNLLNMLVHFLCIMWISTHKHFNLFGGYIPHIDIGLKFKNTVLAATGAQKAVTGFKNKVAASKTPAAKTTGTTPSKAPAAAKTK